MSEVVLFWTIAAIAVPAALMMVLSKNPIHSALWLIVNFLAVTVLFLMLNAQFVAFVHLIVYAGAIMILFLFVIMLLNLAGGIEDDKDPLRAQVWLAPLLAAALLIEAAVILRSGVFHLPSGQPMLEPAFGEVYPVGLLLFTKYLLPFEVTSVLLLVGMVGAIVLAKRRF